MCFLSVDQEVVIATATPASGLAVTVAWQSISWFVIASEAWQSMDRHVASLLAMTQEFFASLLAMTKEFVTSLLTMTGFMGQPQRCQSFSQPGGRLILVAMTGGMDPECRLAELAFNKYTYRMTVFSSNVPHKEQP